MSNFDSALQAVPFTCPHCGQAIAGAELRVFQLYEIKVATWLRGVVVAANEPDFDVYKCEPFPHLTFQVKFSNLGQPRRGEHMNGQRVWSWLQHRITEGQPDYFVLCGLDDDGGENWFVLTQAAFRRHASATGKGGLILQGYSQRFTTRGGRRARNYLYENTIWRYHCRAPHSMIEHVRQLERDRQPALFPPVRVGAGEAST